jgi:RNA polymerase-binding protein DksA
VATTQKRAAAVKTPARAKSGSSPKRPAESSARKTKSPAKPKPAAPAKSVAKPAGKSTIAAGNRNGVGPATAAKGKGKSTSAAPSKPVTAGTKTSSGKGAPGRKGVTAFVPARPVEPVRARKPIFSAPERQKYRKTLLKERSELVSDKESREREALKAAGPDFSVDHMADYGSDNFEQEFTLGLLEKDVEKLRDIDDALLKLEDGSFGLCEDCEERIPVPRLDVIPYARLCIKCKMKEE